MRLLEEPVPEVVPEVAVQRNRQPRNPGVEIDPAGERGSSWRIVEGLHAIVVSDRDGVPVIKVANDNAPEHALRPGFLSTFALATDQGSKLGLSKNKSIICYYNTYQVVQFNRLPLVVSFIASSNANTVRVHRWYLALSSKCVLFTRSTTLQNSKPHTCTSYFCAPRMHFTWHMSECSPSSCAKNSQ
uniref:Ragulator complex protein LAMTOR3 n=1 Tax=Capra hircus TaxID=9925 RepID=A0A8C2QVG7_CAPHI